MNDLQKQQSPKILEKEMLLPFILVAILFPLWGFANDITNPLVRAFKDIFLISNMQSSMVQFAFYLGYGIMAIPAAIFIRSYSYKAGILLGLGLYAIGAYEANMLCWLGRPLVAARLCRPRMSLLGRSV